MPTTPVTLDLSTFTPFPSSPTDQAASALQGAVSYGVQQDPVAHAKLLDLQKRLNIPPVVSQGNEQQVQQQADVQSINYPQFAAQSPRTTAWGSNPDNAAVAQPTGLLSQAKIEQHAAAMRTSTEGFGAYTPSFAENIQTGLRNSWESIKKNVYDNPLSRMAVSAFGGTVGLAGDVASEVGWTGNGPTGENLLQKVESGLKPENVFADDPYVGLANYAKSNGMDQAAPILAGLATGMGEARAIELLGMGEKATKVWSLLAIGTTFAAQSGGKTYVQTKTAGGSDEDARSAADKAFLINEGPDVLAGFMDRIPGLNRIPVLASALGGGLMGSAGQLANNLNSGQPWSTNLLPQAAEGAAMQAGLHIGLEAPKTLASDTSVPPPPSSVPPEFVNEFRASPFLSNLAGAVDQAEQSKLRTVSPDKFHEANQANFEGDPSLLISERQWTAHMQEKGIDPGVFSENYTEAYLSGNPVEVRRDHFLSFPSDTQKALLPDVKDPNWNLTAREFQEGNKEASEWLAGGGLQKLSEQMDAADAETASSPDFQAVKEQFRQQHIDAGETPEVAESQATNEANAYSNMARNAGMKPSELVALYNPKTVTGEAPEVTTAAAKPDLTNPEYKALHEKWYEKLARQNPDWGVAKLNREAFEWADSEWGSKHPAPTGDVLHQSSEDGPLGWYRRLPDGTIEIGRTGRADLSTDLHEWGHSYLDIMHDLSKRDGASDTLKDDYQKSLDFIGAKDGEPRTREQNENWAKATLRYLREGKAPSKGLNGVFQRFSIWLSSIYKKADELGVELTPEIRGVFDRLYAAEEGVNKAETEVGPKLFSSAEEAGWNDVQFKVYADMNNVSVEQAKAQILGMMNDAAVREKTEAWREEEKNVRSAVTADIDSSPEYSAIRSLRRGSLDDGTGIALSKDELVKQFGEDRVAELQKQHPGLYRNEGGMDPEAVAEILGFNSAERMMKALEVSPRRSAVIEQATREYMTAKHGDIRYDGTLNDQARVALENDKRADSLYSELKALKKKLADVKDEVAGQKQDMRSIDVAPIAAYRELAHQMMEQKSLADIQPTRHLDASRKYGREAFDALRKGDVLAAEQAKHKELMNHFLFRAATDAKEFVADSMRKFDRIFKPDKNLAKTRAVDLVNAARAILSAVGLGKGGRVAIDGASFLDGIRNYNPELYDELKPDIDQAISKGANGYRAMALEDFRDFRNSIDTLWQRSRRDMQVYVDGKLRNRAEVVTDLNHRLNEIGPRKNQPGISSAVTGKDKAINSLYEAKAAFRRMEYWANSVDGMKGPGPFTKYIVRPVLQALTDYRMQREEPMKQLFGIISGFDASKHLIEAPELGYTFGKGNGGIGKYELLGAIAHTGNDSNMRKLLLGRGWGDGDAMGSVDTSRWNAFMKRMYDTGTITKADMDGIQKIWDLNDSMKPIAQATYHSLFGYYFKEVKSSPMETPFGTYRGGYVPAKVDPFMVRDAQRNAKMEDLESDFKNSLPSTGMGFTNARVEYNQPLSLDLRVISKHIDDTLRFAMVQPAIRDVLSIMRDRSFSDQLGQMDPVAMEHMMIPWLNRAARQITSEPGMLPFVDNFFNAVRSRVGTATMFGNLANSLVHLPNLSFSALQVEPGRLISSLAHYMGSPRETSSDIIEQSDFMKSRLDLQSRKMQTSINNILDNKGPIAQSQQWFQEHGYFIQHAIWNVSDIITWHASFNKALDEIGTTLDPDQAKAEAIQRADATVRMTQGSDNPEDVARYQVGSPAYKAMIQFTSWFNSMGNLKLTEATKTIQDMGLSNSKARLFYIYAFGMAIPYAASRGLVQAARGEFDTDKPILPQILSWFFGSQVEALTSEIPFGNFGLNATKAAYQGATGTGQSFNDRLTSNPSVSALQSSTVGTAQAVNHIFDPNKEVTGKNVRDLLTMLSLFTRYPVSALGRPAGYLTDVHRGAVVPTSTADAVRGTLTGSPSEASRTHH